LIAKLYFPVTINAHEYCKLLFILLLELDKITE